MSNEIYDALPPIGQFLLSIGIAIGGGLAAWQGLKRSGKAIANTSPQQYAGDGPIPTWAMMGPVHEVMQTIHDMAEESRKQTVHLHDIAKRLNDLDHGQEYTHHLLEAILRNQELRPDMAGVPTQQPPFRRKP